MAGRLGLTLEVLNARQYKLYDAHNTAFIFTQPSPKAYVNGRYIASFAARYSRSGELLIPMGVMLQMRSALRAPGVPDMTPSPWPVASSAPAEPVRGGHRVVIDPGHGGSDPGTTACRGTPEKQVNLIIARRVAAMLDKRGYQVVLTRSDDRAVPLESRAAMANDCAADLFCQHPLRQQSRHIAQRFFRFLFSVAPHRLPPRPVPPRSWFVRWSVRACAVTACVAPITGFW